MEREERERVAVVAAVVEPRGSVVGWGEKDRGYGGSEGRGRQADMTSKHWNCYAFVITQSESMHLKT